MNSEIQGFHFLWVCLFAIVGIALLVKSRTISRIVDRFDDLEFYSAGDRDRILSAAKRREQIEKACWWKAVVPGGLALLYAVLSALNTTDDERALFWAIFCLATATTLASIYLKMRGRGSMRVAPLTVRSPLSVIPPVWFGLAAAVALLPLVEVHRPDMLAASIATCIASLGCAALAWRVANVRAILSGEDVAAESFVDERLRFIRATSILVFALVQVEIFLVMADPLWHSTVSVAARLVAIGALVGYIAWNMRQRGKAPTELT